MVMDSGVTSHDIDTAAITAAVSDDRAGAVVTFAGVVRNHDHGKSVVAIEYVGHPSADDVMKDVAASCAASEGVHAIVAQHRVGRLEVGGVALFVAVSASHRAQAFACAADFVDRIKQELPMWKKQFLVDGSYEWSECP